MKKLFQLIFILVGILSFFLYFYFDLGDYLTLENINQFKSFFLDMGTWALLYLVVIHVILNIIAIPRVFITIFAGYVYGISIGFIYSWIATMIGLFVTFYMVRYLFRESFERRFGSKAMVDKINKYLEKHGIWTVIFLRAIYVVPSSVLNYSFGFTKIKTSTYLAGSAIGFVPVVLFNVWTGKLLATEMISSNGFNYIILIAGIAIILTAYFFKRFYTRSY